jgi:2-polyprenyl-3-methyl-5-hydroxy-6-metoxy-1,4-benzoquinol methylase
VQAMKVFIKATLFATLVPREKYEVVLCTEVLEHIPDPVRAFKKLSNLASSRGYVLISVPFLSLMHQAPYWYSSGISPYWFEYWAKEYDLEIIKLEVSGDYIDLMKQEVARLLDFKYFPKLLRFILPKTIEVFRNFIPTQSRFLLNIPKFNISHTKHKYFSPNQTQLSQFSDSGAKFLYLSITYT